MKTRLLAVLVVLTLMPTAAQAHGLPLLFDVNNSGNFQSTAKSYWGFVADPAEHHDSVFLTGSYTLNSVVTNSLQFTGGFTPLDRPAPFGAGNIAIGSTYMFNVTSPLEFWDPTLGIVPTPETLTIVRSNLSIAIDKDTTFVAGLPLTTTAAPYNGNAGAHNSATFNLPLGAAPGLYALQLQIQSTNATPYGASNSFWVIGINGLSPVDAARGMQALAAVGVPEPSSMALAGVGLAGLGALVWRRKQRQA